MLLRKCIHQDGELKKLDVWVLKQLKDWNKVFEYWNNNLEKLDKLYQGPRDILSSKTNETYTKRLKELKIFYEKFKKLKIT